MPEAPNSILQSVLRAAADAIGATQGWIFASAGDELAVRATFGTAADLVGARVPMHSGFAGYVASSGRPSR